MNNRTPKTAGNRALVQPMQAKKCFDTVPFHEISLVVSSLFHEMLSDDRFTGNELRR